MADVMAVDDEWVVKLDKPEFRGTAPIEAELMETLREAGLPVPVVGGLVEVEGRSGFRMERLRGPLLSELIRAQSRVDALADRFVDIHLAINDVTVRLADLTDRLTGEMRASGLEAELVGELTSILPRLPSPAGVCHFDLHPDNVVVTDAGWRIIDWIAAATGPTHADFARTLLLRADAGSAPTRAFMERVRARGRTARGLSDDDLVAWTRIVAAARLAEGFDGDQGAWLADVARCA